MGPRSSAARTLDEDALIAAFAERFPHRDELEHLGIGDDTAWLARPWDLVTCDLMTDGVHFDRRFVDAAAIAWRCLAANLSDIAAMGGQPGPFTLGLGVPPEGLGEDEAHALADGLRACIDAHAPLAEACWLVGGDVVRCRAGLVLSITLQGRAPDHGPLRRDRAESGDRLVVFAPLGCAAAGLAWLQDGRSPAAAPALVEAHLRPRAELALGQALAAAPLRLAALDLSDGLWRDAARFRTADGRRLHARVEVDAVPRTAALDDAAVALGREPWELAVCGGEDYKLCVAVAEADLAALRDLAARHGRQLHVVGALAAATDRDDAASAAVTLWRAGRALPARRGFEHFPARPHGEDDGDQP